MFLFKQKKLTQAEHYNPRGMDAARAKLLLLGLSAAAAAASTIAS